MSGLDLKEIQYRLLYSIIVAGKSAVFANNVLKKLFKLKPKSQLPFEFLEQFISNGTLGPILTMVKSGNYNKLEKAFTQVCKIDVTTCTIEDLEAIYGIGPKTSRFFMLWTRPDSICAALDVHILMWLTLLGYDNIPTSTPTGKQYLRIEKIFLEEAAKRNLKPSELDEIVWSTYSGSGQIQENLTKNIEG